MSRALLSLNCTNATTHAYATATLLNATLTYFAFAIMVSNGL